MFFLSTTRFFPLFYRIIRITILCLAHTTQIRKTIKPKFNKNKTHGSLKTKIKQKRKKKSNGNYFVKLFTGNEFEPCKHCATNKQKIQQRYVQKQKLSRPANNKNQDLFQSLIQIIHKIK